MKRPLTPRMQEILQLLANGYTREEAAKKYGCSLWAVKDDLKLIHYRLGVCSTNAAVAEGFRRGILK